MSNEKVEEINDQEQIGFHKGSISTLMKERDELMKMTKVVEQIMQAHLNALQELGVNLDNQQEPSTQKKATKIEDLI